ncbi:unnamed protein product [marine sediment metagenome]|uniref:Uncharacterized protein n=1 Tax=marine sediment metagenome TaxID=412755 RepID=X1B345_9ZZZZ
MENPYLPKGYTEKSLIHKLVTKNIKEILLSCGLKEDILYKVTGNEWNLDHIIGLIESNYETLFS